MKRFIAILITVMFVILSMPVGSFALETSACVLRGETVTAFPGKDVDVKFSIENNPGIMGAEFSVSYDEGLTLVGAASGDAFSALSYTPPAYFRNPTIFIWDAENISDSDVKDGVALTLTFHVSEDVKEDSSLGIRIEYTPESTFGRNMDNVEIEIVNGAVNVVTYLPGDVNGDMVVNTKDITAIRRYISDGRRTDPNGYNVSINESAADVDDNGKINTLDITMIRRYISDGRTTDPNGYNVTLKHSTKFHTHNLTHIEAKDAECTKAGNGEYWRCGICGKYFSDAEGKNEIAENSWVIPATGHDYINGKCTRCGEDDPSAVPATYSEGLAFTSNGDGTCYVSGIGTCKDTDIVIPPTSPDGESVTSIGKRAFRGCSSLTSIEIPNSVTSIGWDAFNNCGNLTSIAIPNSVTSIGSSAFYNCSNLTSIAIPNSVTSIGSSAFYKCSSLTSVTFGENSQLTSIGESAFESCTSITSVTIPNSVTSIGNRAFHGCSSLTSIVIPKSVTSIDAWAFNGCSSLANVTFSENSKLTSIGESAFESCTSITSVTIPNSVTSMGSRSFYNCSSLTSITIPDSVTSIGGEAFRGCSSLTSIEIPNSVTSIGDYAFVGCSSLTSVTIPNSVTSIGEQAFFNCSSLTSVTFGENSQLTSIGKSAFTYCIGLNAVYIGNIEWWCNVFFDDYYSNPLGYAHNLYYLNGELITELAIPNSVTNIGDRAFVGCSGLTSIEIPNSVTSIGDSAFFGCSSLTSITIPNSMTSIGGYAFSGCSSLTTVYYTGTEAEWAAMSVSASNDSLLNATKVYNYTPTAHEHTWGAGVVTKAATCTETGVMTYTCSCGETKTEVISKLAHTVEIIPGKAATCTETGLTQGEKCSVCQTVLVRQEVIAALGHNYVEKERHDATCTEDGYILYECDLCHVEKRQVEYATGHSYGYDNICDICGHEAVIHNHKYTTEVIAPTCTKMGYTLFTCECGDSYKANYIDQLGHSWNDGVEEKAPTCTETGIVRYTCTVCGESYTAQIQISHKWDEVRHDATCTEDGEVVRTCSICGEVEREVLPAEHKWNVKEVIQEPSCDADGKQIVVCGVCGEEEEQSIPAKGHIFQNGVCTVCGKTFIEAVSEQVEHPVYGMFFLLDEVTSNYGPETVNEYGVLLYVNEGAELDKVAVYLTQDGTMWRRCIACTGNNIEFAYYVPYLSYGNDILYTGLNSPYINTFALKKGSDGIWRYSEYATIGANLADNKGNLLLSLYQIGQAGAKTRIFDDLSEMKAWLKGVDSAHVHTIVTDEAIPATCTTNGMTAGSHCSVCGEVITAREVVNALGHNYVNGKCTRCGDEEHTVPPTYSEGLEFTSNGDGTCYVSGIGTCKDTDIVIPPTSPGGNKVTSIGERAFYECTSLTSIEIPNSVTSIGARAFRGCSSLTSIEIPNSVTRIGGGVFYKCSSLTSIEIPDSVTSIGGEAFRDCSRLTSIAIPNSVTSIGYSAFYKCSRLTSIAIPNSVTSISKGAFDGCSSLTSITIPDSVTSIGDSAFWDCNSLTSITIPDSVTSIGEFAFSGCNSLTTVYYTGTEDEWNKISIGSSNTPLKDATKVYNYQPSTPVVTYSEGLKFTSKGNGTCLVTGIGTCTDTDIVIPPTSPAGDSVTSIGNQAFYECTDLTSITIPNSVTSIGSGAFWGCRSLTSITMPESVTSIGVNAFSGCSNLKSLEIPDGVKSIGEYAFNTGDSFTAINVGENNEYYSSENGVLYNKNKTTLICVPRGTSGEFVIPSSVTSIDEHAFMHCKNLTSITIPNSVKTIGFGAFDDCCNITNVTFEENSQLTSISNSAFLYCSSLTDIEIPNSVTRIGLGAFKQCKSLTSITIPFVGGLIDQTAYYNFGYIFGAENSNYNSDYVPKTLKTVIITGGKSIREDAFRNCSCVTSITIPESVTEIKGSAFVGCDGLTSIKIPDSVTSIGYYAFSGCDNLKNIEISNSITIINGNTFQNCISLTSITIPNGVTSIGDCAFFGCTSLSSATIPESVTSMGWGVFEDSLTTVYYTGTEDEWNKISIGTYNEPLLNATKVYNYSPTPHKHTWGAGVVTKAATCTETGVMTYTCSCGETKTEAISKLAHTVEIIPGKAATCTETGLTQGEKCSVCKTVLVAQNIIPALGHNYVNGKCTRCDENDPSVVPTKYSEGLEFTSNGDGTCYVSGIGTCTDTDIVIPPTSPAGDSVTSVGYRAFYQCGNITSVVIPNGVTGIGERAFYECSSLTSIVIPKSVTSIGNWAFYRCSSLTSITIPDGVTSIGDGAFNECINLTSITIPNSVMGIGYRALENCSGLTAINVDENNEYYLSENGALYNKDKTMIICVPSKKSGTFEIPSSVTSIGDYALDGCSSLTSVTFGENSQLTSIGFCAFSRCISLTSIVIPNSVTSIGWYSFDGCSNLTSIEMPDSVTSIGCCAFGGCSSLTSIVIPNSVTSISNSAFHGCSSLTSIVIPSGVTSIDAWAFSECSSLTSVTFSENSKLTSIGYGVFSECNSLTSIEIPNSVASIGGEAFRDCSSLTSIVIPNSVTSIGESAFESCTSLASVYYTGTEVEWAAMSVGASNEPLLSATKVYNYQPSTPVVTYSEGLAFTSNGDGTCYVSGIGTCTDTDIVIPPTSPDGDSVTSVGYRAFNQCGNITSVVIPKGVTSIVDSAFGYCSSLTSIEIPNGVTSIGNTVFYECTSLTSVEMPNSVTSIGNGVFYRCNGLVSITIPNGVTTIGDFAFADCSGLTSIVIPNSVTSIGQSAFFGCSGLTSIVIPNSVTSIGEDAFFNCINLTSVEIPNSVMSIGDWAFSDCRSLTSIFIPAGVTSIGEYVFSYCDSLTAINVDVNNKYYLSENGILYNKDKTTLVCVPGGISGEFEIPNSVTIIGQSAFYGCSGYTSIVIPNSVTSIGDYAFFDCSNLTSIEIPAGVTSIGEYVFSFCNSLTAINVDVNNKYYSSENGVLYNKDKTTLVCVPGGISGEFEIPNSVTSIGQSAFFGCIGLTSIVIPNSVTSIGEDAFRYCHSLTTVYYSGTEVEWNKISIGSGNEPLLNATRNYNY